MDFVWTLGCKNRFLSAWRVLPFFSQAKLLKVRMGRRWEGGDLKKAGEVVRILTMLLL